MKLFLFDIDGTLFVSGGAGVESLRQAARERFGIDDDLGEVHVAGRTDFAIARDILARHGVAATPENVTGLLDAYLIHLARRLAGGRGRLLPGALRLLDRLAAHPGVMLALLTGNLARGAELKLTHCGVWRYFQFGAFADDQPDRNALGHRAQAIAREDHGREFAPRDIYVVGDTPHDIACARAIGAVAVAGATGPHPVEELAAFAPDFLFADLADVEGVLRALGLGDGESPGTATGLGA